MKKINTYTSIVTLLFILQPIVVDAEIIGGVEFPQGESSFVDDVIRFDPSFSGGLVPTEPAALDPNSIVGIPDFPIGGGLGDVGTIALGSGGLIEVLFIDNLLTNSGNDGLADIHIFEVGTDVEDTFVAIRPMAETLNMLNPEWDTNNDGFFEIGKVFGSTSSIDIDLFFPNFASGTLKFDAVQLIDDPNEGSVTDTTVGADIDAIGAISSIFEQTCDVEKLVDITSSAEAKSLMITGTIEEQFITLNLVPPLYDPYIWQDVNRQGNELQISATSFVCGNNNPLLEPFISAEEYLDDIDQVSLNNCSSSFYRFTFNLPQTYFAPSLIGVANVDDMGDEMNAPIRHHNVP